ncbi:MmgE/PrpD family protein [Acerihabitans sp.]|uniref:MmgE/PrpD family protein n=1 Tax=Acerihabitans sp. TaxID=2811394 RepID=UPI002ED91F8E
MNMLEYLARWSRNGEGFSLAARQGAAEAIRDTLACMIAGAGDPVVQMTRQAYRASLTAGASVAIGGGAGAPGVAALINATAAHALDYDDTFRPLMGHASAVLVPALLATAQAAGADGRQLVASYLVGLQAQAVIGAVMNPGHYAAGWHATSTIGAIGAAAGAAWLLGLDEAGILQAMCLAISMAAGVKGQFGTAAKPLHAGLAARNAVEAAALAAAGMRGNPGIMDHPFGFASLYAAAGRPWQEAIADTGKLHVIEAIGLSPKRHPCCASTHNAIDMLLDLKAAHGFAAQDVILLDCLVGSINKDNLPYTEPANEMQARFSMHYCLAVALANNRLRLADFTPDAIFDPAIRRFLPLTRMHAADPAREDKSGYVTHKLSVHLRDGRRLCAARAMAKGDLSEPFGSDDRREKFFDCCHGRLDQQTANELYEQLHHLDRQDNIEFIAGALRQPGN